MTEQEVINAILADNPPDAEPGRYSSLSQMLREARKATGRNEETGEKLEGGDHGSWLGGIGYLCLLELIGNCLDATGFNGVECENGIRRAVASFALKDVPPRHHNMLRSLRNSLVHHGSLVNERDKVRFTLDDHAGDLVKIGDVESGYKHVAVNLIKLGDLAEEVVKELRRLRNDSNLKLRKGLSADTVLRRSMWEIRQQESSTSNNAPSLGQGGAVSAVRRA